MTTVETSAQATSFPTRHRESERRGARLGLPLRMAARLFGRLEEDRLDRLGAALLEGDPAGSAVAEAIRTRVVSHADLRRALAGELEGSTPAPLRSFLEAARQTPDWVDWERLERGAEVFRRLGRTAGDVLLGLSLVGGFRFGGPADLLVATGGLTGDATLRRLAETQHWTMSVTSPGAMRPGSEGWRLTLHVRVMHALVNSAYAETWDVDRWGLPVNQSDQAGTLGLFDAVTLMGARALGVRISRDEAAAAMHLWKYVGWLLGVDEEFLTDVERERHWWNLHILIAAPAQTDAGRQLARAILAAEDTRAFPGGSPLARALRRRYNRERVLSLWTGLLGARSMRELGLPLRPPWAVLTAVASNTLKHRVLARTARGREWLAVDGRRRQWAIQAQYLRGAPADVAPLPVAGRA